jgi:hypothetical protein
VSSYYAAAGSEGGLYRSKAWGGQKEEKGTKEGGLRADAAGFRPGQREHRMSRLMGEWEDNFEKGRS